MWLVYAFVAAILLGFYDVFKKVSLSQDVAPIKTAVAAMMRKKERLNI